MSENEEKIDFKQQIISYRFVIIGVLLVLLIFTSFLAGNYYACTGDNTLRQGFRCVEPDIVSTCEDLEGNLYQIDTIYIDP